MAASSDKPVAKTRAPARKPSPRRTAAAKAPEAEVKAEAKAEAAPKPAAPKPATPKPAARKPAAPKRRAAAKPKAAPKPKTAAATAAPKPATKSEAAGPAAKAETASTAPKAETASPAPTAEAPKAAAPAKPARTPAARKASPTRKPAAPATKPAKKAISLALQGGGSHGAFAWGVLDRIFEADCFDVKSIVGTSAGAMNASVAAYGLARGGPEGAREKLREFWGKISASSANSPLRPSWIDKMHGPGNMDFSPFFAAFDMMSRFASPYQFNPMNVNPLRDVIDDVIDFDWMHDETAVKLFICASNVMTGKIKVFTQKDLSIDAVLASACLPFMFQAVEIDGEHYWDGGYMGNPPLFPLIYEGGASDILIVQLNPINITELPTTAQAILDRINTISFNSSLMREMRVIDFMSKLIDGGMDAGGTLKRIYIHTVDGEETLREFGVSSKLNADMDFLKLLFDAGRREGEAFIEAHFDKVGVQSSTDISQKFL